MKHVILQSKPPIPCWSISREQSKDQVWERDPLKSTEATCLCSRCASSHSLLSDGGARNMQFPTWLAGPAQHQARRTYRRIAAASGLRSLLVLSIGKLVPKSLHLSRLLLSINWQTTCI